MTTIHKNKKSKKALVMPILDSSRKDDAEYNRQYEADMSKYTIELRKREVKRQKDKEKRKEYKSRMTPEARKLKEIKAYSKEYNKRKDEANHIDRAIHLCLLVFDKIDPNMTADQVLAAADAIAADYTKPLVETIQQKAERIKKNMERAKTIRASK